jgi:hypothetical protein
MRLAAPSRLTNQEIELLFNQSSMMGPVGRVKLAKSIVATTWALWAAQPAGASQSILSSKNLFFIIFRIMFHLMLEVRTRA